MIDPDDRDPATPDIVKVILERVSQLVPEDRRTDLDQVELDVRAEYAGRRVRISRNNKDKQREKREAVRRDALTTAPDEQILKKHGISRATLYRIVKKPSR